MINNQLPEFSAILIPHLRTCILGTFMQCNMLVCCSDVGPWGRDIVTHDFVCDIINTIGGFKGGLGGSHGLPAKNYVLRNLRETLQYRSIALLVIASFF